MIVTGKAKEKAFAECLMKQYGGYIDTATKYEDIYEHVDLKGMFNGQGWGIDVKGLKRNKRQEPIDENIHGVEIKNVHGYPGGLHGKAHMFAFETEDYWLIIGKKALQELVYQKVDGSKEICNDNQSLYVLYQREFRLDVIVKVKTLDLMKIAHTIITK